LHWSTIIWKGELLGVALASLRRSRPDLRALEVFFKGSLNLFQADAVPMADLLPTPSFATLETHPYVCAGESPRHLTIPGYFRRA
jgi:hypothetical protein